MLDIKILIEPTDFVKQCWEKEKELELEGVFNTDVNSNTYDNCLPVDENFNYIPKGIKYNFKRLVYLSGMKIYTKRIAKYLQFVVTGKENLKHLKNKAAIITCNHISLFDSFAVRYAIQNNINFIAADYQNWNNKMGDISRHTGYLPLSNKYSVLKNFNKAIEHYLERKKRKILIYPEQSLWRNYKKPRPLKNGAFHYATKHNVPIIPLFITLRPSGIFNDGLELMYFTINILKPIYPNSNLAAKENIDHMRKTNYLAWKDCYEYTYNTSLKYTTLDKSKIKL